MCAVGETIQDERNKEGNLVPATQGVVVVGATWSIFLGSVEKRLL
jgi:hypothetical protein